MKTNNLSKLISCTLSIISSLTFTASSTLAQQLTPEKQQEVDALTQQMKANPADYSLYAKRGIIYKKAGKESAAYLDFDRALMIDPKWQQGYFLRAEKFKQQNRLIEAMHEVNRAERVGQLNAIELSFRAKLNADMKNFEAADKDYDCAIALDPNYAPAYIGRALLNIDRKMKVDTIVPDLERAMRLNPTDTLAKGVLHAYRDQQAGK